MDATKNDPLFVQPRVVAKTSTVVRAIVEVVEGGGHVRAPSQSAEKPSEANITQELFLEKLASHGDSAAVELARWVFEQAPKHGLDIDWRKNTASLKYVEPATGNAFRFGGLRVDGGLGHTDMVSDRYEKLRLPDTIWEKYLDDLASLIPGAKHVVGTEDSDWDYVGWGEKHEDNPPLRLLAPRKEEWFAIIDQTTERIRSELAKR